MIYSALKIILGLLLGIWLVLAVACLFLITSWTDEAWVLNGLRSTLEPSVENLSSEVILTSGGPFALVNIWLERAFGSAVWIHRSFSLVCLLGLLGLVYRLGMQSGQSWFAGALAIAPLLGLAGTAEVGTVALGHSAACLLMVLGALIWTRSDPPGLTRAIIAGLLFGMAAACRTEMVLIVVAILVVGTIRPTDSGRVSFHLPRLEIATVLVTLVVLGANIFLLQRASHFVPLENQLSNAAGSAGISGGLLAGLLDYPRILNKLFIGQSFGPLVLMVLASVLPFYFRSPEPAVARFSTLLIASAWMLALGWVLRSPIPHLRYLWPSLMCLAIPAGLALVQIHDQARREGRSPMALICVIVATACLAGGLLGTARSLVLSEGDVISFEWSREMGVDYFQRFQARRDEADVAQYLKTQLPPDGQVYSVLPYKLLYLTHRPIIDIRSIYGSKEREKRAAVGGRPTPKYVVIPPEVGTYFYMTPEADAWYRTHAKLVAQFGRYSIYFIEGDWPEDQELLRLHRASYLRHPLSDRWFGR
jgi:hypothetical protein